MIAKVFTLRYKVVLGDLQLFLDAIQDDQPRLCRITSQRVQHLTIQNNEVKFSVKTSPLG